MNTFDRALRVIARQRWIRLGLRLRMLTLFRHSDRTLGRRFETRIEGVTYRGKLDNFIDRSVFFFGSWEPAETKALKAALRSYKHPVFIDIGANVGFFSLTLAQFANQVHAFEPWAHVREQMESQLRLNGIDNVTIHPVALGEVNEVKTFHTPEGGNTGTGSFLSTHATDRNVGSLQLPIVNGDHYFEEKGISEASVIKIDVEGWEWAVIRGLATFIRANRPILLVEVSQRFLQHLSSTEAWSSEFPGYCAYIITERKLLEIRDFSSLPEFCNILLVPEERKTCFFEFWDRE